MEPDKDKRLIAMGKGEPTCDLCIKLYPDFDECETCSLNSMIDSDEAAKKFVMDSMRRVGL